MSHEAVVGSLDLTHRSPSLTTIYNELKSSTQNRVLDFGSSSAASFNFFTQLSCKIHFESLDDFVAQHDEKWNAETLIPKLEKYLSVFKDDEKFDIILVWDIFNYLDLPTIRWFMNRIQTYCHESTLLHTVRHTGSKRPATPWNFQIADKYLVKISKSNDTWVENDHRYNTSELLKHMPQFFIENTYVNHSGMIPNFAEQTLRFNPSAKKKLRKQANGETSQFSQKPSLKGMHRSYAMAAIFAHLKSQNKPKLLDLGLKNKHNYEFFLPETDELYCENLLTKFTQKDCLSGGDLNFDEQLKFDVVLLWDILNFLSPQQISETFNKLRPFLHSNSQIHGILYSGSESPSSPQHFYLQHSDSLVIYASHKEASKQSITSSTILRTVNFLQPNGTFIFREGMQRGIIEHIFAIKPQSLY